MYADRYGAGSPIKPGSMTLAAAMTALPIVALVLGLQIRHVIVDRPGTTIIDVPIDKPPPPDPQPKTDAKTPPEIIFSPPVTTPAPPPLIDTTSIAPPPVPPPPVITAPPEPPAVLTPSAVKVPVLTGAEIDARRSVLQPPFPAEEARAGRSGRVSLRVLVGTDGRVKQVTRISAASDAFYDAAERQALAKWRFKPATRDGVAIEQWKVMNLSFVFKEQE